MKLEPCPFCGSSEVYYYNGWKRGSREESDEKDSREPTICCDDCGMGFCVGEFGFGISDDEAEKRTCDAWNTRA